ncbi:MAG: glycosyltransferase family 39 protein [candidate division WOR-3 bacterium]
MLKWCLGLFALTAGVRLAYVLVVPQQESLLLDQAAYDALAARILQGKPYVLVPGSGYANPIAPPFFTDTSSPSAVYPPGYPLFLAGIYKAFGQRYLPVRLIQAILWGLCAITLFLIGETIGLRRVCSGLGAGLLALSPPHVELAGLLLSENLFAPLLLLAVLFTVLAVKKGPWWAILAGVCSGLSGLTRPTGAGLIIALGIILLVFMRKHAIWPFFALILFGFLILSPWAIRNQNALGWPVISSTAGGRALYLTATGVPEGQEWDSIPGFLARKGIEPTTLHQSLNEAQLDRLYAEMAREAFLRDPIRALSVMSLNPLRFAFNMPYPGTRPSGKTVAYAVFTGIVIALSFWGLIKNREPSLWAIALVFIYFALAHTVMSPALVRYSLPVIPLLYPIALSGLIPKPKITPHQARP